VIVVDNGSLPRISADPGIILIENDRNRGFARAVNQGIARASGEFIALLNNDAVAHPLWLEQMLRCMRSPAVGMVASKILVAANPSIIDKAGHLIYPDGQNRGRGSGEIDRGQYDREEEVLWPDGCAALYRRSMLDEIGGFDETFFAYGEDAELGLRARIAGWRCVYAPRAVVVHERAATLGLTSTRRVSLIERNRVLLAVKHFPGRLLLLNPFYYAARLAAGVIAAATGRGEAGLFSSKLRLAAALLWGDAEALPRIPAILWKRWCGKSPRRLSASQICDLIRQNRISLRALSTEVARG
jgi:GT2 family glycosyltransferase